MIKRLYKRVIRKFDLSVDQLRELKRRLAPENICKGPFVQGEKNCPNTTALAIKEGVDRFKMADEVKKLLAKYGVTNVELRTFYVLFDIPAMISERFFEQKLQKMKRTIDELIYEKQQ